MKTYTYPKSQAMFERAAAVIPGGIYGHLGPSNGCFIPTSAYPFFAERVEGAYLYDIDGNRFIDYMCAYGPNVLGYHHPEVDQAAQAQRELADCTTLPTPLMVELAELLVDTVTSADWAFFAKNGGDVTSLAIMSARAATGRKKIIKFKGGYHGVAPWTQSYGNPGVLLEEVDEVITLAFNDLEALEQTIKQYPGQIAGVIATPYHHPALADNALPAEGFWAGVRSLCTQEDIVLIIDDVRCGFRLSLQGSDAYYGFEADLICFCKALANGYNISALCGKQHLKGAVSSVFYTGSYWLSAVPMAAAIKTIEILKKIDGPKLMRERGLQLIDGLQQAADAAGFHLHVTGEPAMWNMRLSDDESGILHQKWVAECVRRGVFFTNHHNLFINTAITPEDVDHTIEVAREAFAVLQAERR